jgi:hypothetical protein
MHRVTNLVFVRIWPITCEWLRNSPDDEFPMREFKVTTTKINLLMLFKEIIAVYTETHTKPTDIKYIITDY